MVLDEYQNLSENETPAQVADKAIRKAERFRLSDSGFIKAAFLRACLDGGII